MDMNANAKAQKAYKQRLKDAGLVRVEVWRRAGSAKDFKDEHCMAKHVSTFENLPSKQ
jgi:hypothetical protein